MGFLPENIAAILTCATSTANPTADTTAGVVTRQQQRLLLLLQLHYGLILPLLLSWRIQLPAALATAPT
jgi:hypothetical protein